MTDGEKSRVPLGSDTVTLLIVRKDSCIFDPCIVKLPHTNVGRDIMVRYTRCA